MSEIVCKDSLEFLKEQEDYSLDIVYCDPPYALGSEIIIREDGKVDYKKARDFMNKWDTPTGKYWEQWFKECFRVLKFGGYCIMFSIDRQTLLFKYYPVLSGLIEQQSLYWYFLQNFPKASDISKAIDKHFGEEREEINIKRHAKNDFTNNLYYQDEANKNNEKIFGYGDESITTPTTELAKKYNGYKYSISPLKQTNETILVFKKPTKTGRVLYDTLAYENGDKECCCSALNIDGGRVPTNDYYNYPKGGGENSFSIGEKPDGSRNQPTEINSLGRYPAQTFIECICDEVIITPEETKEPAEVKGGIWKKSEGKPAGRTYKGGSQIHTNPDCPCNILDRQSGILKSGFMKAGQQYGRGSG